MTHISNIPYRITKPKHSIANKIIQIYPKYLSLTVGIEPIRNVKNLVRTTKEWFIENDFNKGHSKFIFYHMR